MEKMLHDAHQRALGQGNLEHAEMIEALAAGRELAPAVVEMLGARYAFHPSDPNHPAMQRFKQEPLEGPAEEEIEAGPSAGAEASDGGATGEGEPADGIEPAAGDETMTEGDGETPATPADSSESAAAAPEGAVEPAVGEPATPAGEAATSDDPQQ